MELSYREVQTKQELTECYPLMKQLRTELSQEDFLEIYTLAEAQNGYKLVAVYGAGELVALMGYRILFDFVHKKHLYIDDLVSAEKYRSRGIGAKVLEYAERLAAGSRCQGLRLCTGNENEAGKKFYLRCGWNQRAVVFKKKIPV